MQASIAFVALDPLQTRAGPPWPVHRARGAPGVPKGPAPWLPPPVPPSGPPPHVWGEGSCPSSLLCVLAGKRRADCQSCVDCMYVAQGKETRPSTFLERRQGSRARERGGVATFTSCPSPSLPAKDACGISHACKCRIGTLPGGGEPLSPLCKKGAFGVGNVSEEGGEKGKEPPPR